MGMTMTGSVTDKDNKRINDAYLSSYAQHLERKLRALETEKQILHAERARLQQELRALRSELDKMRHPPLVAATIVDVLSDGRAIVRSSTGPSFVVYISSSIPPKFLVPGAQVALNQRTFAIVEGLPVNREPFIKNMEIEEVPNVTYSDIGGLDEQIREIRETVELPLLKPELFEKVGIDPPKGILLTGPPGTGKTLCAKAVAHETKATFIKVIASEFVQKFIGEGARIVREIFDLAREKAPTIMFIDELDAVGSRRLDIATSGDREVQRTLMQLLSEMDGFESRGNVRIIAATNRPDILDPALLRPGRFDRIIQFDLPNLEGRIEIFKIHTRRMNIDKNIDFVKLGELSEHATGADIKAITTEAGMFAIRAGRTKIIMDDFIDAIEKVLHKTSRSFKAPVDIYA